MKEKIQWLANIAKSGFVRSVTSRLLAIFITVSLIIATVAFFSFTAEIRRTVLNDRQTQLAITEQTISSRMQAITSIAYNIGADPSFYLEPVSAEPTTATDMAKMISRYLVGNGFVEHLAFCRTAEPDKIYTARGERSLSEFYVSSFGTDPATVDELIQKIHAEAVTSIRLVGNGDNAYFSYAYPLPQLSAKPLAHVLMMIPIREVQPMFDALLLNGNGRVSVFDADGREFFTTGNSEDAIDLSAFLGSADTEQEFTSAGGRRYVVQKTVSATNSWTYISAIRYSDTLSGMANKQLGFIVFILLVLVAAIVWMMASIIREFRPISNLAAQMAGSEPSGQAGGYIDERKILPTTIATLKEGSDQRQKYETAFYEAEAASKAKSAFLSNMSHDIRTPMNAIIGMTALARKHIGDQSYVDDCLQKVQVSSNYLLDIINNVLDMSRIEAGHIPIAREPVLLPALIDNVVSLMTAGVEAKGQTLHVDVNELTHVAVLGDSIHLVQVFVNILSNAVKFTPEGGVITLKLRQLPSNSTDAGIYVFSFADTGIGIPPEFIDQVFETFSRSGDPTTSRTDGTGLGMAIAKKLVELMGGTIACESEVAHGTTFTVTMPMPYAEADAALMLAEHPARQRPHHSDMADLALDLTGKRILLVEDNAMNREIAHRILAETGAQVVDACDGKEAVDLFTADPATPFDLIFMDIQMPVMNGYQATAAIRASSRPDAKTIPIYAMTANTFDEDVRLVKDAGMNGHIGKPYSPAVLYKALQNALDLPPKAKE